MLYIKGKLTALFTSHSHMPSKSPSITQFIPDIGIICRYFSETQIRFFDAFLNGRDNDVSTGVSIYPIRLNLCVSYSRFKNISISFFIGFLTKRLNNKASSFVHGSTFMIQIS